MGGREKVLVVTTVPPDLRTALAERHDLVDYAGAALAAGGATPPAPGFRIALTTSMRGIDRALIDALPDLKLVSCNGAGLDLIDLAAARARGIAVSHTPDEVTQDTAEAGIALTYATLRRVAEADRFVRAGRWGPERMAPSRRVAGKTMGIVGLGRIGRIVAARAVGAGMDVIYHGRAPKPDVPYPFVADIGELAERSDVLMLCAAGGEGTRGLVTRAVLERLGPAGYLVNISRGSVVDEAALIEALQAGTIAGAGLDVFASEPNLDPRFKALENVVLQPHSAVITRETRAAMVARLVGDIDAFLTGRPFHDAAA